MEIVRHLNVGTDDEIAEISCLPKSKDKNYFEGAIYIKTKNNNIVRIVGEMHNVGDARPSKIKNQYDSYLINFRENSDGFSVLDNLTFNRMITLSGIVVKKIIESVKLIVYEYDNNIATKNMEGIFVKSDLDLIKKTPYNKYFWENNEIIKRSSLEKSLIKSFEKNRSFESNFIIEK